MHVEYKFGTMIEIPRAAVTADEIADLAQFFSFGTNDLTQMTFGYSRDDAEARFLLDYVEKGILPKNPFQTLDQEGVGQLMKMAVEKGRAHATRPRSWYLRRARRRPGIHRVLPFKINQNYVSCSPFRVPVARLAAAQAAIKNS